MQKKISSEKIRDIHKKFCTTVLFLSDGIIFILIIPFFCCFQIFSLNRYSHHTQKNKVKVIFCFKKR